MKIKALRDKLVRLRGESQEIITKAQTEDNRDLTVDEVKKINAFSTDYEATQSQLAALEAVDDLSRRTDAMRAQESVSAGRPSPSLVTPPVQQSARQTNADPAHQPLGSFGAFAQAVSSSFRPGGTMDNRLAIEAAAASTFANEALDSEGGAMVPPQYMTSISQAINAGDSLLPLTDNIAIGGRVMGFPADENAPWGTTGILAYWQQEGTAGTAVKPNLKPKMMSLNKLMVLAPVSEELLEDAPALESWLTAKAADAIVWKMNDSIVNGTGVGQPLGINTAASIISQTKETSQTAATINAANVGKMFGRVIPNGLNGAAWLIAPDAYNQLISMTIGNYPAWTPPTSGMAQAPGGFLLGKPVIISSTCQTLGTAGDIYLGAWKTGYRCITKQGGVKGALSMHLYFDADQSAFRFTFRMDGMPWLQAAVAAAYGSSTLGHFVKIETRS